MPFTLHQSNDLEALAEKLAGVLDAGCRNANDPFRREIIVADRQFFRWLQIQIAKRNGLCPATEFLRPGKFIYDHVFSAIENPLPETDPETSDEPPFNPDSVRWRIFALLESGLEKRPEFVRVRNFVNGDALKRFQLSSRLASLFDKYMTERPDVMCDWEKMWDKSPDLSREENKFDTLWQSLLWRELIAQTPRRTLHFSGLFAKFKAESRKPGFAGKFATLREAGRVSVLTPTPLPPAHLEIFRVLAATGVCDIHFLTLNPCREFWADAKKSDMPPDTNPLLASLGKLGSYYLGQFIEPFAPDFEEECFTEYGDSTLLHAIQNSILDNKPPPNSQLSTLNSQLSVHSCHSPQREAEVLRDRLLALLTADPTLQPSDIRVAVTDIDAYAPHIQAVFSTSEPRIPFTISGCAAKNDIPEFGAFLNLISAATGRFKASEILALLNHEPISKRFAFSDDDRLSLPPLLKRAGVAWGADAAFRESQGAARDYANTWRFALDRLILGAAMGEPPDITDTLTLDDGASRVAPLADTHTSAPLIGRAADFLTAVERFATRVSAEARSCAEWIDEMYGTADDFFARDSESAPGLAALRTVFAELRRDITHAGCDGGGRFPRVPFAVIAAVLGERLGEQRPARGADIGFVRFAPLNATAAIPARVVCLMGMNEGVFPRNPPQLSFDITDKRNGRQLRTDRPVPEQDRYAFLLALMAARENFLITYTGQDINDNTPIPPAAPVAELLEFCGAIRPDCEFSITHPLHPFSPRYFDNASPHLVSFDRVNYDIARKLANTGSPEYDDAMLTAVANAEWVLNAEPIARIAAKTFPYDKNAGKKAERKTGNGTPEGKKARKSAQRKTDRNLVGEVGLLFAKIGGKIERENFGTVILTKNGATESIAHGFTTQAKADAFATVPDVIKHGKIISREINWKGRGYDTYTFAAPVEIGGNNFINEVIVIRANEGINRFYLHQVFRNEKTQPLRTSPEDTTHWLGTSSILSQKIAAVKPEDYEKMKNILDGNAETNGKARFAFKTATEHSANRTFFPIVSNNNGFVNPSPAALTLDSLVAFFRSPCRYFYVNRLGVRLEIKESEAPDDEGPLELDALGNYNLAERLVEIIGANPTVKTEAAEKRLAAEGLLTPDYANTLGEKFNAAKKLVSLRSEIIGDNTAVKPFRATIALETAGIRATLDCVFSGVFKKPDGSLIQVVCRPAKLKGKDIVKARLAHLALTASQADGAEVESAVIHMTDKNKSADVMIMGRDTPAAARARLAEFAALFIESENRARPPFFSSEPGLKWAETSGEDSKRFAVAIDSLINDHNKSNDEYLIREYGDEFDEISQSALDDLTRFAKIVFAEEYAQSQTGKRK